MNKIAFITAIYGNIETMCKPIKKQNIETEFICFTDNSNMNGNGWTIDATPYHLQYNDINNGSYNNSINNNKHTRNIAKFYKLQFHKIPCLSSYDVVIWIDSTSVITCDNVAKYINDLIIKTDKGIFLPEHEERNGTIYSEMRLCSLIYDKKYYQQRNEPIQKFIEQYNNYIYDKYDDKYWKKIKNTEHYGLWYCGFIAFHIKNENIIKLLDMWYLHNLKYTNRDQISFPYVCWKLDIIPYTFPDEYMKGKAHSETTFYKKFVHGTKI